MRAGEDPSYKKWLLFSCLCSREHLIAGKIHPHSIQTHLLSHETLMAAKSGSVGVRGGVNTCWANCVWCNIYYPCLLRQHKHLLWRAIPLLSYLSTVWPSAGLFLSWYVLKNKKEQCFRKDAFCSFVSLQKIFFFLFPYTSNSSLCSQGRRRDECKRNVYWQK